MLPTIQPPQYVDRSASPSWPASVPSAGSVTTSIPMRSGVRSVQTVLWAVACGCVRLRLAHNYMYIYIYIDIEHMCGVEQVTNEEQGVMSKHQRALWQDRLPVGPWLPHRRVPAAFDLPRFRILQHRLFHKSSAGGVSTVTRVTSLWALH